MRNLYLYRLRYVYLLVMIVWCVGTPVLAQKTCVVASAEDHVPIREALIHTDNNHWARTDYRGYFTMKYQFDSATVSRTGYVKTTIYLKNLPDTVFLLPEAKQIGEVEVWGKSQENAKSMSDQSTKEATEAGKNAALGHTQVLRFDMEGLFDGRGRRDRRHMKKAQQVFNDIEEASVKEDPIEAAYKNEMARKNNGSAELEKQDATKEKSEEKQKKLQISIESSASISK